MFKAGLIFQKYSQDYLTKLNVKNFNNEYFNIEVTVENKSIDQFIHFLNQYWNKTKKLEKLLTFGDIFILGNSFNSTISEFSNFKKLNTNIESYETDLGIEYYSKDTRNILSITFHSTDTLEEIIEDSNEYVWKYLIQFNGKTFELIKENNLL